MVETTEAPCYRCTSEIPAGCRWVFVAGGFMFDVAAAASSIVLIPATGVIHGTPSIAIDGSEMQHSNVGGALTTKADWCQVLTGDSE